MEFDIESNRIVFFSGELPITNRVSNDQIL